MPPVLSSDGVQVREMFCEVTAEAVTLPGALGAVVSVRSGKTGAAVATASIEPSIEPDWKVSGRAP